MDRLFPLLILQYAVRACQQPANVPRNVRCSRYLIRKTRRAHKVLHVLRGI